MCYSGGADCSCASGERSVGERDEAHEELEEAVHRNVPPLETRVLADEKTARRLHMKGRQTLGRH